MFGKLFFFFCRYSLIVEREHYLFESGKSRNEIVALENKANLFSSKFSFFVIGEIMSVSFVEKIGASCWFIKKSDYVHKS